jgi:DNA polymerase-3 subunit epsilon
VASSIHGITNERVVDAPSFVEVWPEIYKHMEGKLLVIYNAEFDLRILNQSMLAHHDDYPIGLSCESFACAMNKYAEWVGEWNEYHGNFRRQRLPSGNHAALDDCRAVLQLIRKMAKLEEAK